MARSRNKYARARMRAKIRRPRKRGGSRWFYSSLALIVAGGLTLLFVVRSETAASDIPPQPGNAATGQIGDHWHTAFGVNICGNWLDPPQTFETVFGNSNVRAGIHTHGDGFIHTHPFTRSEGGDNATLGKFLGYGGWGASESEIDLGSDRAAWAGLAADPAKRTWSDGDKCPKGTPDAGKNGVVSWSVDCLTRHGNPSDYKLADLHVVALAFLPKGKDIGVPPNAFQTPKADSGSKPKAFSVKSCTTAGPGGAIPTTTSSTTPAATTTTPSSTP